jgi:hypothetical protein
MVNKNQNSEEQDDKVDMLAYIDYPRVRAPWIVSRGFQEEVCSSASHKSPNQFDNHKTGNPSK